MVANRMVLLDHLTRGRVMMGVGPGVLTTDAYMLNIDPGDQRPRMDEALGVILRLLKGDEPVTHDAGWFTLRDARLQLRPYTQPRFPISVTAAQSSSGMVMAGKHGVGVLSMSVVREGNVVTDLNAFWGIAEETAAQHGNVVDRGEWRMVVQVHLADSRKEAIAQARVGGGLLHREYFEKTLGAGVPEDAPPSDKIIDGMVKSGAWCIGTPDDLITKIKELDEQSGGFGGLLIQSTEWGTREQIRHSYELMARYVMPHFQGSLVGLADSEQWARDTRDEFREVRMRASERARRAQAEPSR
jgi:limonene 1,2-monooxygenase